MKAVSNRPKPVRLSEEEVYSKLPENVGKVTLNYDLYPGHDIYSDGDIEDEILAIVKDSSRVEYQAIIEERKSWPILYHLSSLRGNIVDWLPITTSDKVLEIGSGCGAITEKLSERAGHVTCVDLSARRSLINAYRNQDRDNIEILLGNYTDIEPTLADDYDYVCLIGVFEYGQSYISSQTPYEDFLKTALRHIKKNGRVVIAIENKFGLKYWAGCKEDHVGEYFAGLEGYPDGGSARTFTRKGLERIFKSCGALDYHFYYPYPDYKFPTTVYSDKRLPQMGELTDNLRNFDRDRMLLFNEKYVFDGTIQDGLFDCFANSFAVVLGPCPENIYAKFSNDRAEKYKVRTEILDTPEGKVVRKIPMSPEASDYVKGMKRSYELLQERYEGSGLWINPCTLAEDGSYAQFPFEKGVTLEELLDQCLEKNDMDNFYRLFERYYELTSYGQEKAVADYDLIFANILVDGSSWTLIDYEWTLEETVEAKEIAFRAIYCYVLEEEKRNKLDLDVLMTKLGISQAEAEHYREKELSFQRKVTGKHKSMGEIRAALGTYAVDPKVLMAKHLQEILDNRIQVYYDYGEGYKEENSVYVPDVYSSEHLLETVIPINGAVKDIRLDPADHCCMVKLLEISMNGQNLPFQKKYMEANGKMVKPGCYLFATEDPNMIIKLSQLPLTMAVLGEDRQLTVKMEVSKLPKDMAEDMIKAVKMLI